MNKDITKPEEIFQAAKTLNLGEMAGMEEIRGHYRQLLKKWHPDVCQASPDICRQRTEEITQVYKIIISYCNNYRYSFKKEETVEHLPLEESLEMKLRKQFKDI